MNGQPQDTRRKSHGAQPGAHYSSSLPTPPLSSSETSFQASIPTQIRIQTAHLPPYNQNGSQDPARRSSVGHPSHSHTMQPPSANVQQIPTPTHAYSFSGGPGSYKEQEQQLYRLQQAQLQQQRQAQTQQQQQQAESQKLALTRSNMVNRAQQVVSAASSHLDLFYNTLVNNMAQELQAVSEACDRDTLAAKERCQTDMKHAVQSERLTLTEQITSLAAKLETSEAANRIKQADYDRLVTVVRSLDERFLSGEAENNFLKRRVEELEVEVDQLKAQENVRNSVEVDDAKVSPELMDRMAKEISQAYESKLIQSAAEVRKYKKRCTELEKRIGLSQGSRQSSPQPVMRTSSPKIKTESVSTSSCLAKEKVEIPDSSVPPPSLLEDRSALTTESRQHTKTPEAGSSKPLAPIHATTETNATSTSLSTSNPPLSSTTTLTLTKLAGSCSPPIPPTSCSPEVPCSPDIDIPPTTYSLQSLSEPPGAPRETHSKSPVIPPPATTPISRTRPRSEEIAEVDRQTKRQRTTSETSIARSATRESSASTTEESKPAVATKEPARPAKKMSLKHFNLAYAEQGSKRVCRMCLGRREKDRDAKLTSFPGVVPPAESKAHWDSLDRHLREEHEVAYERLLVMSDSEIFRMKQSLGV